MEPITATLMTAKEIYEAAKTIQKVYNVSKEMKTVAESEGKDQIMATKDLAGTANEMKQDSKSEKRETKNMNLELNGDLHKSENSELTDSKPVFVDKLESPISDEDLSSQPAEFVDKLSNEELPKTTEDTSRIYIDKLSSENDIEPVAENNGEITNTQSNEVQNKHQDSTDATDSNSETKQGGLTEQEKQEIKDKTGWSDKIVYAIRTKEEAQIYIDAGLVKGEINSKPALLQSNIDGKACNESKWPDWNNKDLAEEGYPPRDKNGRPYELHHIGQNPDSPLAELTYEQHHSDGNFKVLHTFDESSIDRVEFNKERKEYWSERSKSL